MATQGRVWRSPCPGPWRLESDVSLHVRRARTHRRPARTPGDITSAPPATPLGARPASVTHRCSDARSATRRNSPTSTSRRAAGPPEPASSRRSRANGCLPGELRTAPSRQPQEFRKRLYIYSGTWRPASHAQARTAIIVLTAIPANPQAVGTAVHSETHFASAGLRVPRPHGDARVRRPVRHPNGRGAESGWVRLFFVDGPRGFCQRHGKSYLTRRRRGGEGGGGGLLTGRPIPSAYRWAWCPAGTPVSWKSQYASRSRLASEPPRLQPSWPPGGSRPAHG